MKKFALVLPCFNESESIRGLTLRVVQAAARFGLGADEFVLVWVENGSTDTSALVLQEVSKGPLGEFMFTVSVAENWGYGHGILCGLLAAAERAEIVGWSHADEQCDPLDAFKAWQLALQSAVPQKTLVKGVRRGRRLPQKILSRGLDTLATLVTGRKCYEVNAQPKVFHRSLVPKLVSPPANFAFDFYVLAIALQEKYSVVTFPVSVSLRANGESKWAFSFRAKLKTILSVFLAILRYAKDARSPF